MADEFETEDPARPAGSDSDAAAVTLGLAGASRARADEYLARQSRLTDLRIEFVEQQDRLELTHLRFRHWNDWAKFALQVAGGLLVILALVAIAAAMWNASRADGLVVEAFSVPPDFAVRGMGGEVVAQEVTNKLFAIREEVDATAYSTAGDVSRDRTSDLRVEIPQTGVSLGEVWRALKSWLGSEHHLGGNLHRQADGTLVLSVTLDTGAAVSVSGKDLDGLEESAAEQVVCATDRTSCINFLSEHDRWDEVEQHARTWLAVPASPDSIAQDYSVLGAVRAVARKDLAGGFWLQKLALSYAPKRARTLIMVETMAAALGRSEDDIAAARQMLTLNERDQPRRLQGHGFAELRRSSEIEIARWTGDFAGLERLGCAFSCPRGDESAIRASAAALRHHLTESDSLLAQARWAGDAQAGLLRVAEAMASAQRADWRGVVDAAGEGLKYYRNIPVLWDRMASREKELGLINLKATAEAELGDLAAARTTLAQTNADCYPCTVAQGDVEAVARNWTAAANWYRRAVAEGPSLPFGYFGWGRMLLAKGDHDGAIAKFSEAHARGPHFADPLELWGEALIAKNRSDLALAKFQEAAQYAPNWGRLHLKWGEALRWSGDRAGAQKQFSAAARLDLNPREQAELARVRHG